MILSTVRTEIRETVMYKSEMKYDFALQNSSVQTVEIEKYSIITKIKILHQ